MTYEEFKAANPVFTVSEHDATTGVETTTEITAEYAPETYEAMAQDRYQMHLDAEAQQADQEAKKAIRKVVRQGLPVLEENLAAYRGGGTLTAADQRRMAGDSTKAIIEVIKGLDSLNLLEEDEEAPE